MSSEPRPEAGPLVARSPELMRLGRDKIMDGPLSVSNSDLRALIITVNQLKRELDQLLIQIQTWQAEAAPKGPPQQPGA